MCLRFVWSLLTPMNASKCASQQGATTTHARPALKIGNWTEIRARRSRKLGAKDCIVRCGVRTHALSREPELKSGALDHSANLTRCVGWVFVAGPQNPAKTRLPRVRRTNSGPAQTAGKPRADSVKSADVPADNSLPQKLSF